jgi:predicted MFS family arabinose efflux permease
MSLGALLRRPGLGALLVAEIVSSLGSQMTFLALPWFVLATTGSPTRMGVVLAVELAPVALLGIPSGTVASRLGARRTMLICDLARVPLMISIPVLHAAGVLSFPLLLALVGLMGCFIAPYFASQRVALPELVGDDEQTVAQANAFLEGAQQLTRLLGPVAAGALIVAFGAPNVLYVDAATFFVSFVLLAVFVPRRPPLAQTAEGGGVLGGLRYILRDRLLGPMMITVVFGNMVYTALFASLPVLAFQDFDRRSWIAGAFVGAAGAGSLVGSVIAMNVVGRVDPLKLSSVAIVADTLPLFLLGFHLPWWGVVATLFVAAIGNPIVNAPLLGILTTRPPEALRAKVMTAVLTFATLAGPVGLVSVGPLLARYGAHAVFVVIACGALASGLFFVGVVTRYRSAGAPAPEAA